VNHISVLVTHCSTPKESTVV